MFHTFILLRASVKELEVDLSIRLPSIKTLCHVFAAESFFCTCIQYSIKGDDFHDLFIFFHDRCENHDRYRTVVSLRLFMLFADYSNTNTLRISVWNRLLLLRWVFAFIGVNMQ